MRPLQFSISADRWAVDSGWGFFGYGIVSSGTIAIVSLILMVVFQGTYLGSALREN
ncbi:hypothetical protein EV356DRAFT_506956 [Viridothelium virens]|uniref:Uncharacterized protein n=1 Tax=Viridothelium virens TaxID=1048519 RepID=A0A6A6H0I7_VIRVR|nr:hypothetical protein EV356DRAFT_506956 [Viridothelium virens]